MLFLLFGSSAADKTFALNALREALRVERRRVATKPSMAAVERRLEQKRRRGQTKKLRQPPRD